MCVPFLLLNVYPLRSDKVSAYYASGRIYKTAPIPGAREGVQSLRDAGYRLIVVTARTNDTADESFQWVNHHFPGAYISK